MTWWVHCWKVTELGAYRMLVEQAHDLISAHTTDDRALFLYASGAYNRLLGIDPQVRYCCHTLWMGGVHWRVARDSIVLTFLPTATQFLPKHDACLCACA